jgi:WD40 repeat protein
MPIHLELPDGRRVEINSATALIGRDASCQVALVDADKLEPLHARLRQMAGRWLIESQGDWLLQVGVAPPARMGWLKPGDVVQLTPEGPKLVFDPPAATEPATSAKPDSVSVSDSATTSSVTPSPSEPVRRQASSARRTPLLLAVGGLAVLVLVAILFWPPKPNDIARPEDPKKNSTKADPPGSKDPVKGVVGLWPTENPLEPPPPPKNTRPPVDPLDPVEPKKVDPLDPVEPKKLPDPAVVADSDPPSEIRVLAGHTHYVSDLVFLPGDKQLLTASYDKTLRLWSVEDGRELHRFPGHTTAVTALALSPDGGRAVSGDLSGAIKLWNLETRLEGRAFESAPSSVTSLAFSRDGKQVLSGHLGAVYLWDAATGRRIETLSEKSGFLGAIFGPADDVLIYAEDGKLQRIALADGKPLESRPHPGSLGGVALSADGKQLAVACRDGQLRLSAMDAWSKVRELDQKAAVNFAAFSPDGTRVVSGGQDGALILWNAETGKPLIRYEGHTAAVRRLAFSSDGRTIASGSTDGSARLWRLPKKDPEDLLVSKGSGEPVVDPTVVKVAKPPKRDPLEPLVELFPRVPDPTDPKGEPKVQPAKPDPAANGSLAPPEPATQATVLRRIKELFKEEYAQRKPEGKKALAAKLLEQGADPQNPYEARFVLLREARDLASESADAEIAWQAIDEMARSFKIAVPEMKLAALAAAVPQARTPDEGRTLALMALALMERAVTLDEYEPATSAIALGVTAARKSQEPALVTRVQSRGEEIREIKREYLRIKPALDALALGSGEGPAGAETAQAAGRFLAFYKNEWPRGLKLLARGNDERLAGLAAADLSEPGEGPAQIQLGDGWWELGESLRGLAREQVLTRAGRWYELALPSAGGLDKVRLEKRLAQIAPPPEKPPERKLPDRKLPGKE